MKMHVKYNHLLEIRCLKIVTKFRMLQCYNLQQAGILADVCGLLMKKMSDHIVALLIF